MAQDKKKPVITVKKIDKAGIGFGDHASYIRYPARYGVFKDGKKVGVIQSDKQTYMNSPGWWELYDWRTKACRPIKRFYTGVRLGGAFAQAKKFALNYKW